MESQLSQFQRRKISLPDPTCFKLSLNKYEAYSFSIFKSMLGLQVKGLLVQVFSISLLYVFSHSHHNLTSFHSVLVFLAWNTLLCSELCGYFVRCIGNDLRMIIFVLSINYEKKYQSTKTICTVNINFYTKKVADTIFFKD